MEKRGIGTYLVQGAMGNVITSFLIILVICLLRSDHYNLITLIFFSIYLLIAGFVGAVVGSLVWISGFLFGRSLEILARASIGVLLPIWMPAALSLTFESELVADFLYTSILLFFLFLLPAALMSGSRFIPFRTIRNRQHRILPVTMLEIRIRHALNHW